MCKIFFLTLFLFSFLNYRGDNIAKIEATNEYSEKNIYEKNIYENNKKEFNIKGHLSISSVALNSFQSIFFYPVSYGATKNFDKKDVKYVFKGIPYSFFCWLFSGSLRYDYFFNKTIGIGAKFDLFGDIIKQFNSSPYEEDEDIEKDLLKNQPKKPLEIEKVDHRCSYYFNLFQVQIFMNICYNKQGTNNIFLKKYIGGSLGLTLGLGIEDFIFKRKNFYPIFSFQITPVVIFKPNGFFFSFTCFNLFLNRWPYLKYFLKNKKLPSPFSDTNICTFVFEYILLNCIIMSLKFNFGYSWTLGNKKKSKIDEEQ